MSKSEIGRNSFMDMHHGLKNVFCLPFLTAIGFSSFQYATQINCWNNVFTDKGFIIVKVLFS